MVLSRAMSKFDSNRSNLVRSDLVQSDDFGLQVLDRRYFLGKLVMGEHEALVGQRRPQVAQNLKSTFFFRIGREIEGALAIRRSVEEIALTHDTSTSARIESTGAEICLFDFRPCALRFPVSVDRRQRCEKAADIAAASIALPAILAPKRLGDFDAALRRWDEPP